jgi:hypothetical protein
VRRNLEGGVQVRRFLDAGCTGRVTQLYLEVEVDPQLLLGSPWGPRPCLSAPIRLDHSEAGVIVMTNSYLWLCPTPSPGIGETQAAWFIFGTEHH